MAEGYKVRHGPKKADRDCPCCLFPVQKLGLIQSMQVLVWWGSDLGNSLSNDAVSCEYLHEFKRRLNQ